ncbi:MAG: RtcB family protein [Candidatus Aminicenantia bacterium]
MDLIKLKKISDYEWELLKQENMRVPGMIYGNKIIIDHLIEDVKLGKEWNALKQIANVAKLPGIQKFSIALSDVHPGYGFPIGGVAAFDPEEDGVISFGGVGFDINCGVTTLKINLFRKDILPKARELLDILFKTVPAGLGSTGEVKLNLEQIDEVLVSGARWAVEKGYGTKEDLDYLEEGGFVEGADPKAVSLRAKQRQFKQIGTLGSGNHYLEVQYVDKIYDENAAKIFGLEKDMILVSLHCGSRGLGHQIGMDYQKFLTQAVKKYNIKIDDKELMCAPIKSPEGQKYFSAVCAGINCAFANRQVITHLVRQAFSKVFPNSEIKTFYGVGHNTCKVEEHEVNGKLKKLYVHRKGSTRCFGPGRKEIPQSYRSIGQPALIGGTMGTYSYILYGTNKGMSETFGSAVHGAGRRMSRRQAKKQWWGEKLQKELEKKGIFVKGHSMAGLAEEAPGAYKEIRNVVNSIHFAGIAKKVIRVKPLINVKG